MNNNAGTLILDHNPNKFQIMLRSLDENLCFKQYLGNMYVHKKN